MTTLFKDQAHLIIHRDLQLVQDLHLVQVLQVQVLQEVQRVQRVQEVQGLLEDIIEVTKTTKTVKIVKVVTNIVIRFFNLNKKVLKIIIMDYKIPIIVFIITSLIVYFTSKKKENEKGNVIKKAVIISLATSISSVIFMKYKNRFIENEEIMSGNYFD